MSQAVQLLRDLIALPSVNAAFLPPGDPHAGEAKVADYLAKRAAKARLDVAVPDSLTDQAVDAICSAASTGLIGDGKIFITNLEQAIRIRTGETGDDAL